MLEKRGRRSIFKTGFYMKTHKPKSATFFLDFLRICEKQVICDFSVTIPLATAFFFGGGLVAVSQPPTKKEIQKRLCTQSKKMREKKGSAIDF